ncbi:MAG: hypothetical protein COX19_09640 [Desulfobacterales bacterium CG23_combo_of_CG06-09_8_20_14_all_51_8]|nr:MAG: hypothetical protein COX19_09640 [Desulfobacterales bacterium CG23_combo_of_CG06-09_8_20_14_all_51_8]
MHREGVKHYKGKNHFDLFTTESAKKQKRLMFFNNFKFFNGNYRPQVAYPDQPSVIRILHIFYKNIYIDIYIIPKYPFINPIKKRRSCNYP